MLKNKEFKVPQFNFEDKLDRKLAVNILSSLSADRLNLILKDEELFRKTKESLKNDFDLPMTTYDLRRVLNLSLNRA